MGEELVCYSNVYEISWDGFDDQEDPRLLSNYKKWLYCSLLILATLQLTALSSVWSVTDDEIIKFYHSTEQVAIMGISLFLVSLAVGPLFLGPLSEIYGRRYFYISGYIIFTLFQLMTAFGKNIETVLIGRALTGLGGSVFMSNVAGTITDLFSSDEIGLPMALCTVGPFLGPGLGPVIGGYIEASLGFKWVFYVFLIWSGALGTAIICLIPETYRSLLLREKATRIRETIENMNIYAPIEKARPSLFRSIQRNCKRPLLLLLKDPMLSLLCIYSGFLVAVLYLFFIAFPIAFQQVYDFDIQKIGLSFLGVACGMAIAAACTPIFLKLRIRMLKRNNNIAEPEFRLPQMCVGSLITPAGLFIFAWTLYSQVHWIVPIIASGIFGVGCFSTFNGIMSYIVEVYEQFAASATAANVFVRCVVGCTSPLFGKALIDKLGLHWSMTLIAIIAVSLSPSSFLLMIWGKSLRAKGQFANEY